MIHVPTPAPPANATAAPAPATSGAFEASWSGALLAGLLATLERPASWAVSLVGFLARGGIVAFLLPIVVLPTPAGLQAVLSPLLVPVVFGQVSVGLLVLAGGIVAAGAAWLVAGGLAGAWADVHLVRRVAIDLEARQAELAAGPGVVVAAFLARLFARAPLVLAIAWGSVRLFEASYAELVTPFEVRTPLVVRIVNAAPDALAAILGAWLLGEAAGGLAVREVVLGGRGTGSAVLRGWVGLVRRPAGSLATFVVTVLLVGLAIVPALVASGTSWSRLRFELWESGDPWAVVPALAIFVALWLGGLILAGVSTTSRSAAWTVEWLRRERAVPATMGAQGTLAVGTIGGSGGADRGGWPPSGSSGTV